MARLPVPGADDNTWGSVLNDFLTQSFNGDGTLKSTAVSQANGLMSGSTAGGDLSGALPNPIVAKINGVTMPGSAPTGSGQILTSTSTTATAWTTPTTGVQLDTTASDIQPLGMQNAGSTGKAADASHVHPMPRLDQINSPTAAVSLNSQKITNLANGTATTDAAAFGQIPTSAGTIGGLLASNNLSDVNSTTTSRNNLGAAQGLVPTSVKTSAYTASAGDFVPVDTSAGSVTITLPTAPVDKSRIEIKMINVSGTNTVTIAAGGSDVFNKAGGTTSSTLSLLNQAVMLQYAASSAIWYVQSDDLPLSQLDARYGKTGALVYNVKDYGAKGDGSTDDAAAIQSAVTAAGTAGGTIYFPPGTYRVNTAITPANNISLVGAGIGNTILSPGSAVAAVNSVNSGLFTQAAPLTNFTMAHLTIDGSNQGATYNLAYKGVFCQYLSACTFEDLVIQNCVATGLGIDFLTNGTVIHNVRVVGNGRLNQGGGSGAGANGIGIGTGKYTIEDFVISDCFASGNGRYGIMIESQTGTTSKGMRIHDCYSTANFNHGFGDAGGSGAIWSHCIAYLNSSDGFSIDNGTVGATAQPSGGSIYIACEALANSRYGFSYAPTATNGTSAAGAGNISFVGCKSWNNTSLGFNIQSLSGSAVSGIYITGCDIFGNGASGIQTNNQSNDVSISNCHIRSNAQSSATSKNGINITNSITNLQIVGCKIWDDGGTQKQTYGIAITAGTITTGYITNNDLRGNVTGQLNLVGTLSGVIIRGNVGYIPSIAQPTLPSTSGTATTNNLGYDSTVYVVGGALTSVAINGVTITTTAAGGTFRVPALSSITLSWSTQPTSWYWIPE